VIDALLRLYLRCRLVLGLGYPNTLILIGSVPARNEWARLARERDARRAVQ
jgi:hypothetical protein